MNKQVLVQVFHAKRTTSALDTAQRIHNAFFLFDTNLFTHVANVLVPSHADHRQMLEQAFHDTCSMVSADTLIDWEKRSNVTVLDKQGNRDSKSGDVFVIHGQVWLAQNVGWRNIGTLTVIG